jgi:SAM-dependent methyltransferase
MGMERAPASDIFRTIPIQRNTHDRKAMAGSGIQSSDMGVRKMKEWLQAKGIEDVQKFYDQKYQKDGVNAFKCEDWNFFFRNIGTFFENLGPTHSILDCGCGTGQFLKSIVQRYPNKHPYLCGIELSPTAADLAHETLKGRAAICVGDYLSSDSFLPNTFDVVTCWGTIEHAPSIEEAFKRLLEYAKPGGVVMITVPLEFDGCLSHIQGEPNKNNNERFATQQEWVSLFSEMLNPFCVETVGGDLLMIFRKWVDA